MIWADLDIVRSLRRPEILQRVGVVGGFASCAVDHLDEGVRAITTRAKRYAGNDGIAVLFAWVDELVVPSFEEWGLCVVSVITL